MNTLSDPPMSNIQMGPCGEPCEHPCEEKGAQQACTAWKRLLKNSLVNALDLCFDNVYQEPKKILIVGGCRQRDLAQYIALLLPAADIVLVDPDAEQARRAEEEICCRFKFVTSPLEALPFEDAAFDLTIAHNLFAYCDDWQAALSDVCRVTRRNLFFSMHRPLLWRLARPIAGLRHGMEALGIELPERLPAKPDMLRWLHLQARIKTRLAPFPWTVYMTEMKPMREEQLILAS